MSQIAAQITKINPWEIPRTQVDILSFVMPKCRSLVPAIGFISILQYGTLDETVFLPVHSWAPFGLYHCFYSPGHVLNHISINLLYYSIPFDPQKPPWLMHTSRGDHISSEQPLGHYHKV